METGRLNSDSKEIDGLPFFDALQKAVDKKWSGILRVNMDEEQVGSVFMREGNIAWAVSKNQTENFSTFLERIGLIPRDKLSEAVRKYKSLGKSKKLGELLEEEGLISRDKLRECLGGHLRSALRSLMSDPELVVKASHGEMAVDVNLMFDLKDLLSGDEAVKCGETPDDTEAEAQNHPVSAENDSPLDGVLGRLASLPEYRYSFVTDSSGEIHALHRTDAEPYPHTTLSRVTDWIQRSYGQNDEEEFGKMECIILEHQNGILLTQSTDEEMVRFVTVAFGKGGKLGVIKHKIAELIPSVCQLGEQAVN
jgi:hypothetical protein